jgi:hypothetical protein
VDGGGLTFRLEYFFRSAYPGGMPGTGMPAGTFFVKGLVHGDGEFTNRTRAACLTPLGTLHG